MKKILEVGTHLVIDGYSEDPELLGNVELVRRFLDECPDRMNMTKVLPPYVFRYGEEGEKAGISGIVIIAESHISIHTFPKQRYLNVDVFSCKPFDIEEAKRYIVDYFKISDYQHQVLDRGVEYPRNLGFGMPLVLEERLGVLEKMVHT